MWFDKKKQDREANTKRSNVEIVAHRQATKKVVEETKEVNERLQDLLLKNHFTIKIFLATGGKKK